MSDSDILRGVLKLHGPRGWASVAGVRAAGLGALREKRVCIPCRLRPLSGGDAVWTT